MKIAVLTLWESKLNYGQALQAYALQQVLKSEGHAPYIVKYRAVNIVKSEQLNKLLRVKPILHTIYCRFIYKKKGIWKKFASNGLEKWKEDNIVYSDRIWNSIDDLRLTPPEADLYLVGSDQVWHHLLSCKDQYAYFLDFGPVYKRRIAYAASFGLPSYPKKYHKELGRLLSKMDAVSVREKTGVKICEACGVKVANVCDPTLLLSAEKYNSLINETIKGGVFIYNIYIPDPQNIHWDELKEMADRRKMTVNICMGGAYDLSTECFGSDVNYIYGTMSQFLGGIRDADFVVASGFHLTVFSIIFRKKFVYVPIKGRYAHTNSRAIDLLNQLGLSDRIYDESHDFDYYYETPVEYDNVERLLLELREQSMEFLIESLKK